MRYGNSGIIMIIIIILIRIIAYQNKNMEKGGGVYRIMPKSSLRHKQKEWSWESGYEKEQGIRMTQD